MSVISERKKIMIRLIEHLRNNFAYMLLNLINGVQSQCEMTVGPRIEVTAEDTMAHTDMWILSLNRRL